MLKMAFIEVYSETKSKDYILTLNKVERKFWQIFFCKLCWSLKAICFPMKLFCMFIPLPFAFNFGFSIFEVLFEIILVCN